MTTRRQWYQRHRWLSGHDPVVERRQTRDERPFRRWEPDDLPSIRAQRPPPVPLSVWRSSATEWRQRVHGGLLGRCCGCLLGKPVEGWRRRDLQITGEQTGNWPLTNYWRRPTAREARRIAARRACHTLDPKPSEWLRGAIAGMVEDDDLNYTVTGFGIVQKYGPNFAPIDVASFWCEHLPIFRTYTAERSAYRNFAQGIVPPASARHRNPYREWIGAQIRADFYGYANPGNPQRAAEWAWRDASVSHVQNGIYGAMWVAAMLAAAAVETDWKQIIRAGLAQIPARCRLVRDVTQILALAEAGARYEDAVHVVHDQWDETQIHHWCHTLSNAQIVTIGLLWGDDDFETTIARAVMAGFDTDCNGATCGSLWGVKHGVAALPAKWTRPLRDRLRTGVAGYHQLRLRQLADEMVEVAQRAR